MYGILILFTTDTNSSQKNTESSPKIESFYQIIKEKETEEMVTNNGNNVEQSTEREFIIEEFDMTHFLCKISQGCFPAPRIIFYNKQGKRMQNNENIQIGKLVAFDYKYKLGFENEC